MFVAELGDKTQLATLLLSAQSGLLAGLSRRSSGPDLFESGGGVLLGQWLARVLPPGRVEQMAGLLMLGLGIWLGLQAVQSLWFASTGA